VARETISRLTRQTRAPDGVLVVAVTPGDVEGVSGLPSKPQIEFASRGLCAQRNKALSLAIDQADLLVFFDDDFVPCDGYLANAERLFLEHPDIVGATGKLVADGVRGPGIAFERAVRMVEDHTPPATATLDAQHSLYGCNMALRFSALDGLWFDENLPLYGWQEDIDFTYRLGGRGRLVGCAELAGVHMGHKSGRSPGKRLGYSQVANPLYLLRKKSMPKELAARLLAKNLAANVWRSIIPEADVDRRGRLVGNILALGDLMTGRLHPTKILQL
jgi:hypothetical protein